MTLNELVRKIVGPTLKDLVEQGDFITIRNTFILAWFAFFSVGTVVGVSLVRYGLVPL